MPNFKNSLIKNRLHILKDANIGNNNDYDDTYEEITMGYQVYNIAKLLSNIIMYGDNNATRTMFIGKGIDILANNDVVINALNSRVDITSAISNNITAGTNLNIIAINGTGLLQSSSNLSLTSTNGLVDIDGKTGVDIESTAGGFNLRAGNGQGLVQSANILTLKSTGNMVDIIGQADNNPTNPHPAIRLQGRTSIVGNLGVAEAVSLGSTLDVTGNLTVGNSNTHSTSTMHGNLAIKNGGTDKFTVAYNTGDTYIAGSLDAGSINIRAGATIHTNFSVVTTLHGTTTTKFEVQSGAIGMYVPVTIGSSNQNVTVTVHGNTTLNGTLNVNEAATLGSTLGVTGKTTLSNELDVAGYTVLGSTLGVTDGALRVKGTTTLDGSLRIGNINDTPHPSFSIYGDVYMQRANRSTGFYYSFNTGLTEIKGETKIYDKLSIIGSDDNTKLSIDNNGTITGYNKTVRILSNTLIGNNDIDNDNNQSNRSLLYVYGNIVSFDNEGNPVLTVNTGNKLTSVIDLNISGNIASAIKVTSTAKSSIAGALTVGGITTLNNNLNIMGVNDTSPKFSVGHSDGNTNIAGTLNVNKTSTLASLNIINNTGATPYPTVFSISNSTGDTTIAGTLKLTKTTGVTNTPALIIGDENGKHLLVSPDEIVSKDGSSGSLYINNRTDNGNGDVHISTGNSTTTIHGKLNAQKNVSISGTLSVIKATTISSTLDVTGATTLSSTLDVTDMTTLSQLKVNGTTDLGGSVSIGGNNSNYSVDVNCPMTTSMSIAIGEEIFLNGGTKVYGTSNQRPSNPIAGQLWFELI